MAKGSVTSHESRVSRSEVQNRKSSLRILGFAFCLLPFALALAFAFAFRTSQLVTRTPIPFPRQGRLANQLSLSTSQTPASIMMATDPTGTKTRLYSAVSRAR